MNFIFSGLEDLFRPAQPGSLLDRLEDQRRKVFRQFIRKRPKNPVFLDPTKSRSNENFHDVQVTKTNFSIKL